MLLEKNGKTFSSKRTKHIKVRYFFIQDKINQGKVSIKYCPTQQMWSDIFTKPLQGQQFRLMRSKIMNCPIDYDEIGSRPSDKIQLMIHDNEYMISSQECVDPQAKMPHRQSLVRRTDDDVVGNGDTGGMAKRDTLPMARKVRWKDLEKEEQSKDTRKMLVLF